MTETFKIRKKFKFECAHRLYGLENSPCQNIHGHSYKVWIEISVKQLNYYGMVIDFSELKEFQEWLDETFDHALILSIDDPLCLNTEIAQKYHIMSTKTTAENMAKLFTEVMTDILKNNINMLDFTSNINYIETQVAETEGNIAIYKLEF